MVFLQEIYFLSHVLYCNFAINMEHDKLFAVLVSEVILNVLTIFLQGGGKSDYFHLTEIWFNSYQIVPYFSSQVPHWNMISSWITFRCLRTRHQTGYANSYLQLRCLRCKKKKICRNGWGCWMNRRQWAGTERQEILSKEQGTLFYYEGDPTLPQFAQRDCGVYILWDAKKHYEMVLANGCNDLALVWRPGADDIQRSLPNLITDFVLLCFYSTVLHTWGTTPLANIYLHLYLSWLYKTKQQNNIPVNNANYFSHMSKWLWVNQIDQIVSQIVEPQIITLRKIILVLTPLNRVPQSYN